MTNFEVVDDVVDYLHTKRIDDVDIMKAFGVATDEYAGRVTESMGKTEEQYISKRLMELLGQEVE